MAIRVEVPYTKTFVVAKPLAETFTYLTQYENGIARHFPGLEKFEHIGGGNYRWKFSKLAYGGYEIDIAFVTKFEHTHPHLITLTPVNASDKTTLGGKWELTETAGKTQVSFQAALSIELPVPAFLKSMAEPLAKKELIKLLDRYTENVAKALA